MPDTGLSRKQIADRLIRCGKRQHALWQHPLRCACLLCNILQKHRPGGFATAVFLLRVQEASVILRARRRGAPEVVRSRWFAGIPALCGRGEGAKKLSSVPGGHILGGMGEPAQLFRPISWIDLSDITLIRTSSYKGIVGGSTAVFQTIRRGTRALDAAQPMQRCRARSHFSGINSASAAVDSMKLGGH